MLAFQTMNTKRRREEDSDSEDERYLKRSRPWSIQQNDGQSHYPFPSNLPLRPSITPSPPGMVSNLEAMTPAQSEHSEANSPASIHEDAFILSSPQNDMDYAMQMDEDELDMVTSQPPDSPFIATNFRPAKLNPDLFSRESAMSNTGRIPTPIYPNFHTSGMNGLGYPGSGLAGGMSNGNGYLEVPHSIAPTMQAPPTRKQNSQTDQDRTRRMPSPISENEDVPDTPTALTQSQLSRLSVTSHVSSSDQMDTEMAPPAIPPTPARGRKRSGAFTMGRFSMGYRDDCEKCRQRVPGHYSHFLP